MTIEFYWTVSCGIDNFLIESENIPTAEEAWNIVMSHCVKRSIDPYFASWAIAWWVWSGERKSYKFSKNFRDEKKNEIEQKYNEVKKMATKRPTPFN